MTNTTNGWPGEPGVPMNPEKDGWHWVRRIDEKQAHIQRWIGGQFWLSPSFGGPKTDMANYEYLGPCLTPDEATALQARVAELKGALRFYADDENWRRDGKLDPNSGNFTGGPARTALERKKQ